MTPQAVTRAVRWTFFPRSLHARKKLLIQIPLKHGAWNFGTKETKEKKIAEIAFKSQRRSKIIAKQFLGKEILRCQRKFVEHVLIVWAAMVRRRIRHSRLIGINL
jgi:hypothetical protein